MLTFSSLGKYYRYMTRILTKLSHQPFIKGEYVGSGFLKYLNTRPNVVFYFPRTSSAAAKRIVFTFLLNPSKAVAFLMKKLKGTTSLFTHATLVSQAPDEFF